MGNLLCMLLGILLAFAAVGLIVRRAVRPMAAASSYRNVAWRLGLDADTRGVSMQGFLDRRRLFVGEVFQAGVSNTRTHVRAVLDLSAPLGLGLLATKRHADRLERFRRVKVQRLEVGDPEIDEALELRAFEPERAKALFTDEVRDAVCRLLDAWPDIQLTDHWVQVRLPRHPKSDRELLALVEAMRAVGQALASARAALPASPEAAAFIPAWDALAARRGLVLDPFLPALTGTIAGQDLVVHAARREQGFGADLFITFPDHPPLGLQLSPQRAPDGFWSVGQDIQVGHQAFDDAFVIKGYDPNTIRGLLGPEVRAVLLDLTRHADLKLHDLGIELHTETTDPQTLDALFDGCAELVRSLAW